MIDVTVVPLCEANTLIRISIDEIGSNGHRSRISISSEFGYRAFFTKFRTKAPQIASVFGSEKVFRLADELSMWLGYHQVSDYVSSLTGLLGSQISEEISKKFASQIWMFHAIKLRSGILGTNSDYLLCGLWLEANGRMSAPFVLLGDESRRVALLRQMSLIMNGN